MSSLLLDFLLKLLDLISLLSRSTCSFNSYPRVALFFTLSSLALLFVLASELRFIVIQAHSDSESIYSYQNGCNPN